MGYLRKTDKTLTNTEFSAKLKTMTETFNKLKSYGDGGSIQKSLQNIQNSFNELSRQHANWRNGVKTKIENVMNQFAGLEGDITNMQDKFSRISSEVQELSQTLQRERDNANSIA